MKKYKVVLVTGASRGIGRGIALSFVRAGFDIAALYRAEDGKASDLRSEIEASGRKCELIKCDVSVALSVRTAAESARKAFGSIDVIVNNAGICRDRAIVNMTEDDWDSVIRTNLNGPYHIVKEFSPLMRDEGGSIINIASIAGVRGNFGGGNYAAAKAGLIAFTKTAAKEFGDRKITVNAVLPGYHLTDMGRSIAEKYSIKIREESVLNTTTGLKELSDFVVFLSGMKTVSGQVFNWDSRILR